MSRNFQLNVAEDTLERPHHNRKLTEKGYRKRVDLSKIAALHHGRTLGWVEGNGISKASSAELDDTYLDPVELHWMSPAEGNPLEFHWMIRDHDSASNPVEYHWIPRAGLIQWNTTGSQACGSSSEIPLDRKRPAHPVKFHWTASVRLIQWNSTGIPAAATASCCRTAVRLRDSASSPAEYY
ncbi:hypothetical protein BJ912DRAFT_1065724 [Pholiota molesta]|nr:hypothetical protein BJ912DRAFT_1065724 [Pholiota molesta]